MRGSLFLFVVILGAMLAGIQHFWQPKKPPGQPADEYVAVVAEPKYYVKGVFSFAGDEMEFFQERDPKRMLWVDGFVFEIIEPREYAGCVFGMHHDGFLASGDPYQLWEVGRRYELKIPKEIIGKRAFGPCSIDGHRKLLPK